MQRNVNDWQPKPGDECWWQPTFNRKGLLKDRRRAFVLKTMPDGTVHIKTPPKGYRFVKIETLKPV